MFYESVARTSFVGAGKLVPRVSFAAVSGGSRATYRMTRQKAFEASHRYWVDGWSADENLRRFGPTTGRFGHGHNYMAWATLESTSVDASGMLLNLTDLDAALAAATAPLDHRFLNLECASLLRGRQPSTEMLALVLWEQLTQALAPVVDAAVAERPTAGEIRLAAVRLAETADLWADVELEALPMIQLTRAYSFSAAHRLARPDLDDDANRRLYGKCANPFGHGHDYRLEVSVRGEADPTTGMVVDLVELDAAVRECIVEPWDHRHLNAEIPPFDTLIPTSENVVRVAWDLLQPRLGPCLEKLTLYETPRGSFEYRGPTPPAA